MVASTRFRCSYEADSLWSRLRSISALVRATQDAQRQGVDWGERALGIAPHQSQSDLGTEARTLHWDCQSRLMILEARGACQQAGVALARRQLGAQRLTDIRERYGLDYATAEELMEKVKEWIAWACSDDDGTLEPELGW